MPPLVGWAAATGGLTLEALLLFAIIFLWTPPHFWALSLLIRDDYERTGMPMLPVVRGDAFTRRQILLYAAVLVAFTLVPVVTGMFGGIYLGARRASSAAASSPAPPACCAAPRSGPRCSSTWARSPTSPCSSPRWRPIGSRLY